ADPQARLPRGTPTPAQPQAPQLKVTRTDDRRTIDGHPCTRYEVLRGGEKQNDLWVTPLRSRHNLGQMLGSMGEFMSHLTGTLPGAGVAAVEFDFSAALGDIDGFPVLIQHYAKGNLEGETRITEIGSKTVSDTFFEVAPGYQKADFTNPAGRRR
ncbi:MAG: hypothetical protein ACE5JX_20640, partial [Acidobacteriota bacterium]